MSRLFVLRHNKTKKGIFLTWVDLVVTSAARDFDRLSNRIIPDTGNHGDVSDFAPLDCAHNLVLYYRMLYEWSCRACGLGWRVDSGGGSGESARIYLAGLASVE